MTSVQAVDGAADKLAAADLNGASTNGNGHAAAPAAAAEENGEGADEEDEDDEDEGGAAGAAPAAGGAKKKNKKKKSGAAKKKAKAAKAQLATSQTEPPRVGLSKLFSSGQYPVGELQEYDPSKFLDESRARVTQEELRERERLAQQAEGGDYNLIRKAAEAHRQARAYARKAIKPGMTMTEIANLIEDSTRALVEENGFEAGIGFPTGLSLNECAAHYTPNAGDKRGACSCSVPFSVILASETVQTDSPTPIQCCKRATCSRSTSGSR